MTPLTWTPALVQAAEQESGAVIDTSAEAVAGASRDWGGIAQGVSVGVAAPTTTVQVARLVRFAYDRGLRLTIRSGGLSQSGQSVPRNGLSVSMLGLRAVSEVRMVSGAPCLVAESGATWREVLNALGPSLAPCVVPLNLDLTVGGTLSAGGVGSTSHHFGPAACNVNAVSVVSGTGEILHTSRSDMADVFASVLGGVGRFGAMTAVELALRRTRPHVRTFCLLYDQLDAFLLDQRELGQSARFDHMEGFVSAAIQGLRKGPDGRRLPFAVWFYGLHLSVELDSADDRAGQDLLSGLRFSRLVHVEEDTQNAFSSRYDSRFDTMRLLGAWTQAHPWFECLLPWEAAHEFVPRALGRLPMFFGDGHRLTCIKNAAAIPSLAMPGDAHVAFAVLPMGIHPRLLERALEAIEELNHMVLTAGGKRYFSGWVGRIGEEAWRRHYGGMYDAVAEVKARVDPGGTFDSCLELQ